MLLYLAAEEPDLGAGPMVAVGCSAGAVSLPAVVARLHGRVTAAVLIGGGADVFQAITRSDLMGSHVRIQWAGRSPTRAQLLRLHDAVLDRTTLDPYHTARLLAGMPVLVIQARFDRIVPASTGDLLYERLARPERWTCWAGHLGMFWLLPMEAGRIAGWIDQATQSDRPR
jgi:pimeloyl-ACP methyl ester carboxylesterase